MRNSEEARLYLEHQSEGYFTNDLFVDQVSRAVDIFDEKYPEAVGMFIFDNDSEYSSRTS